MDLSYKNIGGKLLRCGYTTGSCAAAAAKAATAMLLTQQDQTTVSLKTPKGIDLTLDVLEQQWDEESASCAIKKDSGDDPDITNGILIYASVRHTDHECITIKGGSGVGKVTKAGLDQPIGALAINSVPRQMIVAEVTALCKQHGCDTDIEITFTIPQGEALSKRTFNPRIGIVGGISIIGTTGIVEPMSNTAMIDTTALELRQLRTKGVTNILLMPGNYGESFSTLNLKLEMKDYIVCSNFIGDAINTAVELGFDQIMLVGHIGKLVKLGIGITNTHSSNGDGRMETLLTCALEAGADLPLLNNIASCVMTDAALALLAEASLLNATMNILGKKINLTLTRHIPDTVKIGFLCFTNASNIAGVLCQSDNATDLLEYWRKDP